MREERSFCRMCLGFCGTRLTLDDRGALVEVRGDKAHPMTAGYACSKGLAAPDLHNGPERLLHPMKRQPDGGFAPIALETALDEIAETLAGLLERETPDSIGVYGGTHAAFNATVTPMLRGWMQALGSKSYFTTTTVDQSAKTVTTERLGFWEAGRQTWASADVWMFLGTNPLVSVVGGVNGFPALNPTKQMREAKARGMKLIVVDPRRTETALQADLHLAIRPGEDVALLAGMLRTIFAEGWEDSAFVADHVNGLDALKRAVEPFTPDHVASRAGISPEQLFEATAMFARDARRGCAFTGTGPSMSPRSNLTEHMVQNLNVVCGRFLREGEQVANPGIVNPQRKLRAQAHSPARSYETAPLGRVGNYSLLAGEMMTCTLADEILLPGPGQIKALFVAGANPITTLPDQHKVIEAFKSLDLLVSIDPYMTSTAKLSHYVLPPPMMYERPDLPLFVLERALYPAPFMQYTPAHAARPEGAELAEDWYVFWSLARRLGVTVKFDGVPLDPDQPPSSEDLLAILMRNAAVSLEDLRRHPAGAVFDVAPLTVSPMESDAGRFEVAPPDILEALSEVAARPSPTPGSTPHTHLLAVRRIRETINTLGHHLPSVRRRRTFNGVQLHPADLEALSLGTGARVEIVSDHGRIPAIIEADATLRPGVATMTHGWGGLPEEGLDYEDVGACTSLLIDSRLREPINAMGWLSSIPVHFERPSGADRPRRTEHESSPTSK